MTPLLLLSKESSPRPRSNYQISVTVSINDRHAKRFDSSAPNGAMPRRILNCHVRLGRTSGFTSSLETLSPYKSWPSRQIQCQQDDAPRAKLTSRKMMNFGNQPPLPPPERDARTWDRPGVRERARCVSLGAISESTHG